MFDVIPYWMWASSLLVLALVCGAAAFDTGVQPQPRAHSAACAATGGARQTVDAMSPRVASVTACAART